MSAVEAHVASPHAGSRTHDWAIGVHFSVDPCLPLLTIATRHLSTIAIREKAAGTNINLYLPPQFSTFLPLPNSRTLSLCHTLWLWFITLHSKGEVLYTATQPCASHNSLPPPLRLPSSALTLPMMSRTQLLMPHPQSHLSLSLRLSRSPSRLSL